MTTSNYILRATLVMVIMLGTTVRAEFNNSSSEQSMFDAMARAAAQQEANNAAAEAINKKSNDVDPEKAKFGSGMAKGIFDRQTGGIDRPVADMNSANANSREQVLANMQGMAASGAGIAVGVGAAMIGAGIPMSMDFLNIPRMIAGLELIAKGGIEIAQGAARAGSANEYGNQRSTLNSGATIETPTGMTIPIADEDLKKLLGNSGISPEEFKSRLASGEFTSAADILRVLGREVDPEALKEGLALANSMTGEIVTKAVAEKVGDKAQTITGNEQKKNENGQGELAGDEKNKDGSKHEEKELAANDSEKTSGIKASEGDGNSKSKVQESSGSVKGASGTTDLASLYAKLFGPGAGADLEAERNKLRQELAEIGISLPVKGVSIFALAHRQYREFGQYRKAVPKKQSRVAQR